MILLGGIKPSVCLFKYLALTIRFMLDCRCNFYPHRFFPKFVQHLNYSKTWLLGIFSLHTCHNTISIATEPTHPLVCAEIGVGEGVDWQGPPSSVLTTSPLFISYLLIHLSHKVHPNLMFVYRFPSNFTHLSCPRVCIAELVASSSTTLVFSITKSLSWHLCLSSFPFSFHFL